LSSIKYVFVINPHAGKGGFAETLVKDLRSFFSRRSTEFDIHLTTGAGDAIVFANHYPITDEQEVCFVACGGDGTFNEVVNGAFGRENASFAIMPWGSGNDYIKSLGGKPDDYLDLQRLLDGQKRMLDVIDCGGRFCANLCNIGIDSIICERMAKFKKLPGVSGPMAYNMSTFFSVLGKLGVPMKLTFDDGEVVNDEFTLTAFGNGNCYGGGYYPTPDAKPDDGILDFCGVKKIGLLSVSKLIGSYKAGKHVNDPNFKGLLIMKRCRSVNVESTTQMVVCIDGEIFRERSLAIRLLPAALPVRVPKFD